MPTQSSLSSDRDETERSQSRRQLLRNFTAGTAAVTGLSGCSALNPTTQSNDRRSSVGGENAGDSGSDPSASTDTSFETISRVAVGHNKFNPYSPAHKWDFGWWWEMFDELAIHDTVENRSQGAILNDWEYTDDGRVIWNIRPSYTWHNGDDLTARDIEVQLKIGRLMNTVYKGYGSQPMYHDVQTTGKHQLEFTLDNPDISRRVLEWLLIKQRSWIWSYRGTWGKYADMYDEASTEAELNDVRKELTNYTVSDITDAETLPGNSIWQISKIEGSSVYFEPFDDYQSPFNEGHTGADIDWTFNTPHYPNQQQRTEAMKQEMLDESYPPKSDSAREALREKGFAPTREADTIQPTARHLILGWLFNFQDPVTSRRAFRKAFYHVVPRTSLMKWNQDWETVWVPDQIPTGLGQDKEIPWFGGRDGWPNNTLESFNTYAVTQDDVNTDKATKLLENDGFTKNGGSWYAPNGDEVKLDIYAPTTNEESVQLKAANIMKSFLRQFGFTASVTAQNAQTRSNTTMQSGDWQLMTTYMGAVTHGPPYFDCTSGTWGLMNTMDGEVIEERENWGMEPKQEVPWPVGNPNGNLKEVDILERITKLKTQMPDEERQQKITEIAWIYNQLCPSFPTTERGGVGVYWINKDRWRTFGPEDDENPVYRYQAIQGGEYLFAPYVAKFGTKWFGPEEGN